MIPLLQFDPATLTLWYDSQLLAACKSSREVGLALHYALDGEEERLKCIVRQQEDEWTQTRCASVASAVWHEKRHFLDFVLTNYGAMRVRHFLTLYMHAETITSIANHHGPLLVPFDRNLDVIRQKMMGTSFTDQNLIDIATQISNSKKMILQDRRPIPSRFGTLEIGGEAIFECIAYHLQLGKTHRVFGKKLLEGVQRDNPSHELVGRKYLWVYTALSQAGLMDTNTTVGEEIEIRDEPMIPLLYGALAGRYHGQPQTKSEVSSSYHPGERLASLIIELQNECPHFSSLSLEEAWIKVNQTAETIFGRSILDEIDSDYAMENELINRYASAGYDGKILEIYNEFHTLRGRFIDLLKDNPEQVLGQADWSDSLVNKIKPYLVAAAPAGTIGDPPNGYQLISGCDDSKKEPELVEEGKWWWIVIREKDENDVSDSNFGFTNTENWSTILDIYAPFAKLLLDGNRMRSMVGPEIFSAINRLEGASGISFIVDPLSRYPQEEIDISQWYFLTGRQYFYCNVTNKRVDKPHGRMIGAWELRTRPSFINVLVNSLPDELNTRMKLVLWRDWSPWLVCDEIGELFDQAEIEDLYFTA